MKELSIEEKAKAYDEVIKKAESLYKAAEPMSGCNVIIETLLPELKESEDERIRKRIIHALHGDVLDMEETTKAISWLEKQGEPEDMGEVSDGYHTFNELYYYRMLYNAAFFNRLPKDWVHKSKRHHDGEECFGGGWFIVMANLPTGQISNHYELKDWDLFQIPEKDIADEWDGHTPQEAAERLHKFLLEKQGEQKPIDKVEPKFKVGDWVIDKQGIVHQISNVIENVTNHTYGYDVVDGGYFNDSTEGVKLWTIQDAKDGDVLACPLPKGCESGEQIFIFKEINSRDYVENCIEYYCRVCEGEFYENKTGYMGTTSSPIYPATKEQRDTLIKAMTDSGWGFDFEKKELKKIEQKSQRMVSAEAKEALYDKPTDEEMKELLRTEYEKGRADVLRCIDPDEMVADFCSQPLSKTRSLASIYRQGIIDIVKRINNNEKTSTTGTHSIDGGRV